jgi:hypothetical protein
LEQDAFHRSLLACCLEVVTFSYKPPGSFPLIAEMFDVPLYHFYKVFLQNIMLIVDENNFLLLVISFILISKYIYST